jgi:fluoride exporter
MFQLFPLLAVMLGGCIGAACRYGTYLCAAHFWGSRYPWGTLAVNWTGCLLIGLILGWAERSSWVTPNMRLFFITGVLGSFTTFSTFAVETVHAATMGSGNIAMVNVVAHNAGGLALVLAGLWCARVT